MKLTSPTAVRRLLDELQVRPSTERGQNFLIDQNILELLLGIADPAPEDCVLEVGPGLGTLTEELLRRCRRVVAVESDHRLHAYLRTRFQATLNLELIGRDFLQLDDDALCRLGFDAVVANLPYSVGTRILVNLIRSSCPPRKAVVTVQLEVAERLAAEPGSGDYGMLSVWTHLCYDVRIEKRISPTCFYPVPQVWSAIVTLARRGHPAAELTDPGGFFDLSKHAFTHRRKQLATILSRAPQPFRRPLAEGRALLQQLGIAPEARPESLPVAAWVRLANALAGQAGQA